jgi:hypothetical protein
MLFLALYPTRLWKKVSLMLPDKVKNATFLFMECFQGHYKDGTAGTYDYRPVSCFCFALRLLVGLFLGGPRTYVESSKNGPITAVAIILIAVSMFYANVQPCKKRYMNVIESILYCSAGLLLIVIVHNNHFPQLPHIVLTAILVPSIAFMGIILYNISVVLGIAPRMRKYFTSRTADQEGGLDGFEPHRLTHPTQYTPLLQ